MIGDWEKLGSFMSVQRLPAAKGRKTGQWVITNSRNGSVLGGISWYSSWRQFCFFPEMSRAQLVFSHDCLMEIKIFIEKVTLAHREGLAEEKKEKEECDGKV